MTTKRLSATLGTLVSNDFKISLVIALVWQLILTIVGFILSQQLDPSSTLFAHTFHWDAGWYHIVISDHYTSNAASAAFYPLFPLLVGGLHTISFGLIPLLVAAQIINLVSIWLAIVALLKVTRHFLPNNYRFLPVILLLSAPAAFFLHMFYTEAIFIAIGFSAYALALERRWLLSCILLGILTACRLPAILFIALCFLEFCRSYDWQLRKVLNKKILLFLLTPVGFIGYGIYLLIVKGNFLAMFSAYHATTDWTYQVFNLNIFETFARICYQIIRAIIGLRPLDHDIIVNHLIPVTCLGLLLASSLYLIIKIKGKGIPLGIFGLLSFIMFCLNSNVVSVHRYTLSCLCIYLAIGIFTTRHKWTHGAIIAIILVMIAVQSFLLFSFINDSFAG